MGNKQVPVTFEDRRTNLGDKIIKNNLDVKSVRRKCTSPLVRVV